MARTKISSETLSLLQDRDWLYDKIVNQGYSCNMIAKQYGTSRTTVEKYRVMFGIEQKLTAHQQMINNYNNKSDNEKQEILDKRKNTNLQLYGEENTFISHKEAIVQSLQEKYGVNSPLQSKQIMDKQKQTMRDRYGRNFISQTHISLDTIGLLDDKDWLYDQHITQKKTLKQISEEIGVDPTTVERACFRNSVQICIHYQSIQQKQVSDWLTSLGLNVQNCRRDLIKGELDIFLPDYKIAIEYCGVFWHSDAHSRINNNYHLNKLRQCDKLGIRLITLFEDEWLYKKDIVKSKIKNIIGISDNKIYARQCIVDQIFDNNIKRQFFDDTHIQGNGPGSLTYCLKKDDQIVAMMTFKQRADSVYELNRYSTIYNVVGGFSKLLTHFQRNNDWNQILSFADLRWSNGGVYDKMGFVLDDTLPPDYRYVIGNKTYHKFGFRRDALANGKVANFDPGMSEVENTRNNGIYRIFNCGLLRYVLNNG